MIDGSIRVDTAVETDQAEADLSALEKECAKTAEKIEEAGKKMNVVFDGKTSAQLGREANKLNKELEKTKRELDSVEQKLSDIQTETDSQLQFAATDDQAENLLSMEEYMTKDLVAKRDELVKKAQEYQAQLEQITAEVERQTAAQAQQSAEVANTASEVSSETAAVREVTETTVATTDAQREQTAAVRGTSDAVSDLGKQAEKAGQRAQKAIGNVIKRLSRAAIAVLGIRSAFALLRKAASAYMDDNEKLGNQINAIWNVIGTAIGPAIEKMVGWLTTAISYVNAFVVALTGVNLVAKANAAALSKQAKATEKASKSMAGFDDINKLSDPSASGNSGNGGDGTFKLDDSIDTDTVDRIADKFLEIKDIVLSIGAGLLTWSILDKIGLSVGKCAEGFLIIAGTVMSIQSFLDMLENGVNWENLAGMVAGVTLAAVGLGIAFGEVGAAIGIVVGGLMLIIAGFKDWLENGKSVEALSAIEIGILAIGGALAVVCGWPALVVAAIAGVAVAVVMYWDEIKEALSTAWDWVYQHIIQPMADFFAPLIDAAKAMWRWLKEHIIDPVFEFFGEVGSAVKDVAVLVGTKLWEIVSGVGKAIWSIIQKIGEILAKIVEIFVALARAFYDYIIKPLFDWLAGVAEKVYEKAIKPVFDCFKGIGEKFYNAVVKPILDKICWLKDRAVDIFKGIATTVVEFFSGVFKSVINGVLATIEKTINFFIRALNGAIGLINKIPGVNIQTVAELEIPRLAAGAVIPPNREFLAVLGDQRSGMNIEAPADLIRQIVAEELDKRQAGHSDEQPTWIVEGSMAALVRDLRVYMQKADRRVSVRLVEGGI